MLLKSTRPLRSPSPSRRPPLVRVSNDAWGAARVAVLLAPLILVACLGRVPAGAPDRSEGAQPSVEAAAAETSAPADQFGTPLPTPTLAATAAEAGPPLDGPPAAPNGEPVPADSPPRPPAGLPQPPPPSPDLPQVSPLRVPECPKLESRLQQLTVAADPAAAASRSGLTYEAGRVRVVIELVSATAAPPQHPDVQLHGRSNALLQATVLVASLCDVSNLPSIRFVRAPLPVVDSL